MFENTMLNSMLEKDWFMTLDQLIESNVFNHLDKYHLKKDTQKRKLLIFSLISEFQKLKNELKDFEEIKIEIDYYLLYCMKIQNLDKLLWLYYITSILFWLILDLNLWYLVSSNENKKYFRFMINDIKEESFKIENKWNFEKVEQKLKKVLNNIEKDSETCRESLN